MALLTLLAVAAMAPVSTRIGMSLNVPEGGGERELLMGVRQQIRLGLNGATVSMKWSEIEQSPGAIQLKPMEDRKGLDVLMGTHTLVTLQTIDTNNRSVPSDLQALPWDDPVMLARFEALVEKVCQAASPDVKWISLGNEVDAYLTEHFSEVETYKKFLAAGRKVVKRIRPDIKVGVTTTWGALADGQGNLVRDLQTGMDATIFTYYNLGRDFAALPVSMAPKALDEMLQVAGTRPLLLPEVGYPAAELLGSSEANQAAFVREFLRALPSRSSRIELAVWFIQVDFSPPFVEMLQAYYKFQNPRFAAYLGSIGLHDSKGKPRAAWRAFQDEVRSLVPEP